MPTTLSSTNFFGTGKKPRSSFPAKALLLYSLYIKPASLFFVPFFLPFSKLLQLSYATFKRFWCFATKQYTISLCAYFSISKASPPHENTLQLLSAWLVAGVQYQGRLDLTGNGLDIGLYAGLCDNTITEPDIGIDVEILQNFVILRCYWYCKNQTSDIVIEIDIAR